MGNWRASGVVVRRRPTRSSQGSHSDGGCHSCTAVAQRRPGPRPYVPRCPAQPAACARGHHARISAASGSPWSRPAAPHATQAPHPRACRGAVTPRATGLSLRPLVRRERGSGARASARAPGRRRRRGARKPRTPRPRSPP
jgi:hypothetical protein